MVSAGFLLILKSDIRLGKSRQSMGLVIFANLFTHNGSSRTSYLFRAVHYLFIVKAVISHGKR